MILFTIFRSCFGVVRCFSTLLRCKLVESKWVCLYRHSFCICTYLLLHCLVFTYCWYNFRNLCRRHSKKGDKTQKARKKMRIRLKLHKYMSHCTQCWHEYITKKNISFFPYFSLNVCIYNIQKKKDNRTHGLIRCSYDDDNVWNFFQIYSYIHIFLLSSIWLDLALYACNHHLLTFLFLCIPVVSITTIMALPRDFHLFEFLFLLPLFQFFSLLIIISSQLDHNPKIQ